MEITRFRTQAPPWQPPGFAVLIVVGALIAAGLIMWIGEPASALGATRSSRGAEPVSRGTYASGMPQIRSTSFSSPSIVTGLETRPAA
jgi:hypothetical protein